MTNLNSYRYFTQLKFFLQAPGQIFFEKSKKNRQDFRFQKLVKWEKKQTAFRKSLRQRESRLFKKQERRPKRRSIANCC